MAENFRIIDGGVTAPKGFIANGHKDRKYGVTIIASEVDAVCAGVFTTNKVFAHPVSLSKETLKNSDTFRAIIANSGNANCFTKGGMDDARAFVKKASSLLNIPESQILSASTGVIGRKMAMDILNREVEKAYESLKLESNNENAAKAIMTTDAFKKTVAVEFNVGEKVVKIGGIAKGAGMIAPNMLHATMLGFITTDIEISKEELKNSLQNAADESFNNAVVDGDMSTNDTVFVLANGKSNVNYRECIEEFDKALLYISTELAKMIVSDGEGAKKLIEAVLKGAATKEDAKKASMSIVRSLLLKTAIHGADPNWGRIAAAVGYSGAEMDMNNFDIIISSITSGKETYLVKCGEQLADEGTAELKMAQEIMKDSKIRITVDLKKGEFKNTSFGCDLGYEYVRINSEYTT
ncbi:arginine biosynthesis bifunctional protein ArgJ [Methanococcus vannielii SB]|jgi:glutamate N-acetyltransferase/amino-acid N-acetyltransferase|uniref:Glutamate N-acetyltransferase n=1 Tax=Methanococcus vannielii (strain ATCC 35089 / DSM 1224 / JCM 13029 / OCM 148 / SB) TaxID=406327 RepID=ARGJ_METVS|nr:bifunctional ornithine acetyltransferase/N-acetylglutamate synthase [Methanococcus vannielii]A6UN66.1 RecName: Full=Arginine biosynthesis bifunctional protein ArgJ; Includes: RecName: Full=Glutamate N-acetyltransferase; AltName: Full=Ornithine acetyltransferase; Short=OATase; AltName: Full=Ornithine transacetylase; Includes: RecName: Full=Amino-acid acetyltransferase; AltName: Full=N-acetylglutamate synthase; Short=AGSase; Contains: RecName: Full=Arginine biosynthesis bifunctional protein ArgJ 